MGGSRAMSEPMWFYWSEPNQVGPFSKDQLTSLYEKGVISGTTLVAQEHSSEWSPLERILTQTRRVPAPPIQNDQRRSGASHWYRHLGSTISLILGVVYFISGLIQVGSRGRGISSWPDYDIRGHSL